MNVGHDTQTIEWKAFQQTVLKWFHRPDWLVCRAVLATAKALEIETTPVWLMVIGPSSCGKSELYLYLLNTIEGLRKTSDVSLPGLLTFNPAPEDGLLARIGEKGVWAINDFSSVLSLREETRNQIMSACREIFDGEYRRTGKGVEKVWRGRVHIVAACTPAIEGYYRMHAELGERFLQVQLERAPASKELSRKTNLQRRHKGDYHADLKSAASAMLDCPVREVYIPDDMDDLISTWAEITARCRCTVSRNTYNGDITKIGEAEGPGRIQQQYYGLAQADTIVMRRSVVGIDQLELIERVSIDCLPRCRRAVLRQMLDYSEELRRYELQLMTGISHNQTFQRTLEDLEALDIITLSTTAGQSSVKFSDSFRGLVQALKKG